MVKHQYSAKSGSAYAKCLDAYVRTTSGIHLWIKDITPQSATVYLQWTNPPGVGDVQTAVTAQGVTGWTNKNINLQPNAAVTFLINRAPNSEVRVLANGGGFATDVFIPQPISIVRLKKTPSLSGLRNGQDLMVFCHGYEGIYEFFNQGPGHLQVFENCGGCKGIPSRGGTLGPGETRTMALNNGPTHLVPVGGDTEYYWKEIAQTVAVATKCP
jgi:hypothetical protein